MMPPSPLPPPAVPVAPPPIQGPMPLIQPPAVDVPPAPAPQFASAKKDTFKRSNEVPFKGMTLARVPRQAPLQPAQAPQNNPNPPAGLLPAPAPTVPAQPPLPPQNQNDNANDDQVVPQQPDQPDQLNFGCSKKSEFKI